MVPGRRQAADPVAPCTPAVVRSLVTEKFVAGTVGDRMHTVSLVPVTNCDRWREDSRAPLPRPSAAAAPGPRHVHQLLPVGAADVGSPERASGAGDDGD